MSIDGLSQPVRSPKWGVRKSGMLFVSQLNPSIPNLEAPITRSSRCDEIAMALDLNAGHVGTLAAVLCAGCPTQLGSK